VKNGRRGDVVATVGLTYEVPGEQRLIFLVLISVDPGWVAS